MFRESPSGTQENEARDSQTDHPLRSAREGAIGRATRDRTSIATDFSRDIGDAVALLPHLARGERVLDVGTGGGVPGVLLAIMRPDLRVELCESVGKRAAQTLLPARASGPGRFDTLVVRAVAPLEKLLGSSRTRWFPWSTLFLNPHIPWYRKSNPVSGTDRRPPTQLSAERARRSGR